MNQFTLSPANTFVWNRPEFIQFLVNNRGQPIKVSTNFEGPCLKTCGVYELLEQFGYTDVVIQTSNCLERHPRYQFEYYLPFAFFEVDQTDYRQYHVWSQEHVFGCFYNRPLWYRLGLASTLQLSPEKLSLLSSSGMAFKVILP